MVQKPWQQSGFRSFEDYLVKYYGSKNGKIDIKTGVSHLKAFSSEDWKTFLSEKVSKFTVYYVFLVKVTI